MKFARVNCITAIGLFTLLAISVQLVAQDTAKQNHHHKFPHYQLIDVGTFGGPNTNFFTNGQAARKSSTIEEQSRERQHVCS